MLQTAGEEGSEEVKQGVVSALTQKAAYDTKKPWCATDGDAVVNPSRMMQEYAGGALLGGLISGARKRQSGTRQSRRCSKPGRPEDGAADAEGGNDVRGRG